MHHSDLNSAAWDSFWRRDYSRLRELAAAGAELQHVRDINGLTMLHRSVNVSVKACNELIKAGAEVDVTTSKGSATALMYAARDGSVEIVRTLLDAGAGLMRMDVDGSTALHFAAGAGNLEVCRYLVAQGLLPSHVPEKYPDGYRTPSQCAVVNNQPDVIRYFALECGEDLAQRTLDKKTLLQLSSQQSTRDFIRALKTEAAVASAIGRGVMTSAEINPKRAANSAAMTLL